MLNLNSKKREIERKQREINSKIDGQMNELI